jgi:glycine cleavage system pyridoxal-binding protein P
VHLSLLGPQGLRETGETCMALAQYAKERLEERGLELVFPTGNVQGVCRRTGRTRDEAIARRATAA